MTAGHDAEETDKERADDEDDIPAAKPLPEEELPTAAPAGEDEEDIHD